MLRIAELVPLLRRGSNGVSRSLAVGVVGLRPQHKPLLGQLKTLGRFVCVGAPSP